mmetsp:Transcript_11225/g.16842  ORF Transcript_11225/g.16842 Transcript_11225/m.16842 type:complete len:203 (+) Transcript_11225:780-1388(+)
MVALSDSCFFFRRDDHLTALAARESGEMFPPSLQEDAAESKASVTSASSNRPVPVEITMAHFPMAARRQWWDRFGFHSIAAIGFLVSSDPSSSPLSINLFKSQLFNKRDVCTSQSRTTPASSPLTRNCPSGLTLKHRTITVSSCFPGTQYSMHLVVGKGRKSLALGSWGTKLSGSIFNRRFIARGHKYRSRHRSKRSFTACS